MRRPGADRSQYAGQGRAGHLAIVGLDDWEWGVTLFAGDPLVFRTRLRDALRPWARARSYALFGRSIYFGIFRAPCFPAIMRGAVAVR